MCQYAIYVERERTNSKKKWFVYVWEIGEKICVSFQRKKTVHDISIDLFNVSVLS